MNVLTDIKFFLINIFSLRSIIIELAKRDFKSQYASSLLGIIWVYLQPLVFIVVIYLVFSIGFRVKPSTDDVPYSVWLISGMIGWLFFSTNLSSGPGIINQYSYMVKKVDFRLSILPLVKLLSTLIPHIVFICISILIAAYNGFYPSFFTLQIFYYLFAMSSLILGINWLTSSANVFIPDVSKVIALVVQFGLWLTPIFWSKEQVPGNYHWMIDLNPMTYIVSGYRDSLIHKIGFWEKPIETVYFWLICLTLCALGAIVFKRLRPHFAEVI